jgi:thiamine kinase-like enzyme
LDPLADILEKLAPQLGEPDGPAIALEGGITNRNYVVGFGGERFVVRLPGKDTGQLQIDRGAEREAGEAAARAGVGPEVAAMLEDPPCLVTRFVEGREMGAADLREPAALEEVGTLLAALHGSGERVSSEFSSFRIVETYAERARRRGAEVPAAYEEAHATAARIEVAMEGLGDAPVLCHNDLLAANFLGSAQGIRLVDWEYAGIGSRYFDLGNFAVNNELGPDQEAVFLAAYFGAPAAPAQLAALRLMRFMSDFREAMWGVLQGTLSDLDFDFAGYAGEHFDRLRKTAGNPRFPTLLEEARSEES